MKEQRDSPRSMRPFMVLWSGQAVSLFGSQLVQFALIWWLTQETGSATVLALASLVGLLPQVLLGPFAGVLVDRWSRRWVMLVADVTVALATIVLALLFLTDQVQIAYIYIILFVRALGGTFHWAAMQASTSLMVPDDQLTRIQGMNQMLQGGLNIVAAPLGALLIALLPMQGILAIDVLTAVVAIVTILAVPIPQPRQTDAAPEAGQAWGTFRNDLVDGLKYVRGWRGLLILMGYAMLVNMVLIPSSSLVPLLVTDHFGGTAWHLGALESAIGIGIVVGGLLLSVWGGFTRKIVTSLVGLIGIGLGVILTGAAPASLFTMALVGMAVTGIMSSMTNGPILATLQSTVEPQMQGRVFTLMGSAAGLMMPVGLLLAGPMADLFGVQAWYMVGGSITILAGISGFFVPSLMNLEDTSWRTAEVNSVPLSPDDEQPVLFSTEGQP